MEQAETYLEIKAECPYCGYENTPEWAGDNCDQLHTWHCELCKNEFAYAHPENQYGLAK